MASRIRIAVDCMGGDLGLRACIPAAVKAQSLFPDLDITLVGSEQKIALLLKPQDRQSLSIVHAPDVVTMSDKPTAALKNKKQSSMRIAIDLLLQQQVDAVVSAGNTGALMAMGCMVLKTLPGIIRPAICSALPTTHGHSFLLDLGANVDCSAEHLHQFAAMGSVLASAIDGGKSPRVALLNIGEESGKGNEQVKLADALFQADPQLNYIGFAEADKLFSGNAEVIVADGFTGNIALKSCEGTASYIGEIIQFGFNHSLLSKLAGIVAGPVLKTIFQKLDPQQYNGASFLGLNGVVVKAHGNSSAEGFFNAIVQARSEVATDMINIMTRRLSALSL
ncbi:MAG: phosphate acyltransferase PlsX [Oceanicoccus sp.]